MFHTPAKLTKDKEKDLVDLSMEDMADESVSKLEKRKMSETFSVDISPTPNVRRSIGEWESGRTDAPSKATTTLKKAVQAEIPKPKPKTKLVSQDTRASTSKAPTQLATGASPIHDKPKVKYIDRLSEARACVTKAKLHLGNSRNIKTEIKTEVTLAIERLYQLVKESETAKGQAKTKHTDPEPEKEKEPEKVKEQEKEDWKEGKELMKRMEQHAKLIEQNNAKMEQLKESLDKQEELQKQTYATYASAAAAPPRRQLLEQTALHSVVVTAKNEMETGEEILNRIRKVVNAKEGGIAVEKIRKAKDRKVIVGCRTEGERQQIKERLQRAEEHLIVEEVKNKDPLVILRDVFQYNTDTDILDALWNQNEETLKDLKRNDSKVEITYKKRSRNPQTNHVIMRVAPTVWQRLVEAGTVMIDLQRVRVADQSPLVQCSLCLGYGHGRRFCKETIEKCSHCGGPHMRSECADWLAGDAPKCCNCTHAKAENTEHNAFSQECPIRRKWEALARATIAYC